MKSLKISKQTARRFVLGRQGLWPGRRWKGKAGTAEALTVCEAVQLDPLAATARSQDLVLHSRVLEYQPGYLERLLYKERRFFDYGGWLAVYPMPELPYWRHHMARRSQDKRVEDFVFTHEGIFEKVREELRRRGPLGNRDVDGAAVVGNYRGRKDTSLALFDMWLSGELMIHHRDNFSRVYDFREHVAPPEFGHLAPEPETEEFFARKCIAFKGLIPEARWKYDLEYYLHRSVARAEMRSLCDRWIEEGAIARLELEGVKGTYLVLSSDVPLLETLENGSVPRPWKPRETTTLEEVTLLSPLDIVSARGRAQKLFDFEYRWEVYTPAHQRRWGYYTLPILYGDELVARLDPKLDRSRMSLQIRGFWAERPTLLRDADFLEALARGLQRFAGFLGAQEMNLSGIRSRNLKLQLRRLLGRSMAISARSID